MRLAQVVHLAAKVTVWLSQVISSDTLYDTVMAFIEAHVEKNVALPTEANITHAIAARFFGDTDV